jgi:hypothetical protein
MLMSSLSEPKTNVTDERAGHSGPPTQRGSEKKEPVTDVAGSMVAEIGLARLSNNDNKDWEVGCDLSVFTSEATALRSSSCRCCCKTPVLTTKTGECRRGVSQAAVDAESAPSTRPPSS